MTPLPHEVCEPNDYDEKANSIGYFAERLNRVFSYFFCVLEFGADEDFTGDSSPNSRAWALQTIQQACLHTTLIALRDLDDVLTPRPEAGEKAKRQVRRDDFKISDLGYPEKLAFLSDSERTAIDKQIAHSTLLGSKNESSRWDLFELVTKGVKQSLVFLEWAASKKDSEDFQVATTALVSRISTKSIYDNIAIAIGERRKPKRDTDETETA